jgi:hypothetical protein
MELLWLLQIHPQCVTGTSTSTKKRVLPLRQISEHVMITLSAFFVLGVFQGNPNSAL